MKTKRPVQYAMLAAVVLLVAVTPACYRGGRVEVRAIPNQAYIYVDGVPTGDAGQTQNHNAIITNLSPGEHTIGLYHYGYKPEEHKVTVEDGKTAHLNVAMTPVGGTVSGPWGRIQIEGADHAAVLLNGKKPEYVIGNADEFNNNFGWKQQLLVPPGTHELTVVKGANTLWSGKVTVAANQRVIVHVKQNGSQVTNDCQQSDNHSEPQPGTRCSRNQCEPLYCSSMLLLAHLPSLATARSVRYAASRPHVPRGSRSR